MKQVLVPVANGTEEIEGVTVIDVLRRAGAVVTVASVEQDRLIEASRGVRLMADCTLEACIGQRFDLIVLPGGMPGAERLRDCQLLSQLLQQHEQQQGLLAAICAAPAVVLQPLGLLPSQATAHPAFIDQLPPAGRSCERVVSAGRCITSRGPGTALEFSLALVEALYGAQHAAEVAAPMVVAPKVVAP